ncbi:hypothetical protein TNCV_2110891 [Trichonephila clavipes]|nr:hypothetical protein TNCV_2110891 [Trichonephila clavipes]
MKRLTFKFIEVTQEHSGILALAKYMRAHFITSSNGRHLYPALLTAADTSHSNQFEKTGEHTSSLAGTGDTCIQHFSQLGTPGIRSHPTRLITNAPGW